MLIPCPCCGPRDVAEFSYGGDATWVRPSDGESDPEVWCRYVYVRTNPRGPHLEYWQHTGGCRLWLKVRRDTLTHEVQGAELVGSWATQPSAKLDAAE
ncbi:MAG TPA: sarcosine oxidase subunit delta [Geminicoccaceae bacterium]|nr:sarcosine oxidase subunit delta [Geminicoccaceae bacterium]